MTEDFAAIFDHTSFGETPMLEAELLIGFLPAFQDMRNREVQVCRLLDGRIADTHSLDHLPKHWVAVYDQSGRPQVLNPEICPGFLRGVQFLTLHQLRHHRLDG